MQTATHPLGSVERPLRVAIVGAGPSGFYAAASLLGSDLVVDVDLIDRLPVPYGLVRGGVAPDHQKIKSVVKAYERTAGHSRFRFFGNVHLGRDISLEALHRHYDQVCLAVGTEAARDLGIPGEELQGSHSATAFVGWYNGHPDHQGRSFELDAEAVVVVGVGNVAVDVARILSRDPEELAPTDISEEALAALRRSRVRDVYVLGRRGPAQASFTPAELKELGELKGVDVIVPSWSAALDPLSRALVEGGDKATRRNLEILQELSERAPTGAPRRLHLWMLRSPVEVLGADGRMVGVRVEENELVGTAPELLRPRGTGRFTDIPAGMLLRAVGYRGVPVAGVPFDARGGVIPNEEGRVVGEDGRRVPGLYVVGWAKRGPSGVIGTNRADAVETVSHMVTDATGREVQIDPARDPEAARAALQAATSQVVEWSDWQRIDAEEVRRGSESGRVRTKLTRVEDMLALLGAPR